MRTCRTCRKPFQPTAPNHKYCGDPCQAPSKRPTRPLRSIACEVCGSTFEGRGSRRYCSVECQVSAERRQDATRRALRRTVLSPTYIYKCEAAWRRQIQAKWGGVCADCGVMENGASFHSHHITPKSKGGKNTIANGVLLCPDCHQLRHEPLAITDELVERIASRVTELLADKALHAS